MPRHKFLSIPRKLKRRTLVLANESAQPGLGEPHSDPERGRDVPVEFLGRGVDGWGVKGGSGGERTEVVAGNGHKRGRGGFKTRGFVRFGVGRETGVEEGGGGGVDGAGKEHETFGENIRRKSTSWLVVTLIKDGKARTSTRYARQHPYARN